MTRNTIITVVLVLIIIAAIIFSVQKRNDSMFPVVNDLGQNQNINSNGNGNTNSQSSQGSGTTAVMGQSESAVRAKIIEFGQKLKNVSLLAPDVSNQIQSQYSSYVVPSLLAQWKTNPRLALGRSTSSPWPERIDVTSVTEQKDGTYKVEATVYEVTADQPTHIAGSYPVTITVEKFNNSWLITHLTKGSYTKGPELISLSGVWECLPHKNSMGPQTLECAYGLKTNDGKHYSLNLSYLAQGTYQSIATNSRVQIEGTVMARNSSNEQIWQIYPIEGIIAVTKIQGQSN